MFKLSLKDAFYFVEIIKKRKSSKALEILVNEVKQTITEGESADFYEGLCSGLALANKLNLIQKDNASFTTALAELLAEASRCWIIEDTVKKLSNERE